MKVSSCIVIALLLLVGCGEQGKVRTIIKRGGEYTQAVYTYNEGKKTGEARYYFNIYEGDPKTKENFEQGPLLCSEMWLNGKLHGETSVYLRTGEVFARYNYQMGRSHGTGIQYFKDGKIADERSWVEGKQGGIHSVFYPSGNPKEKTAYKNNKKEGSSQTWYDTKERLESETEYMNGFREGIKKNYYLTGQLASLQEYKKNKLVGTSRSFYRSGAKMEEINHTKKTNDASAYRAWDSTGNQLPEGQVLDIAEMDK